MTTPVLTENFKVLSEARLREARVLFLAGENSGAYYLAGYSLECALKAVILRSLRRYHMPDKKLVADAHTHDLEDLVRIAGLEGQRQRRESENPNFARNWAVAKDWNESSRYRTWTAQEAADLITAITQRGSGVLPWVKKAW